MRSIGRMLSGRMRPVFKRVVYFALYYSGMLRLMLACFRKIKNEHVALILFYHRFHDDGARQCLLPSLHVEEFERQIRHLKELYTVASMDEVACSLRDGTGFSSPTVVVTMDDGYLDNYRLAYPVLKRHEIPAIVYVTTGLIGSRTGLWVDELERAILSSRAQKVRCVEICEGEELDIENWRDKKGAFGSIFRTLLPRNNEDRRKAIDELHVSLEIKDHASLASPRLMLNWEEIRRMAGNGVSIGAHTASHPNLASLGHVAAGQEIRVSKEALEVQTGRKVRHFAIPNGKPEDFTAELGMFCQKAGFDTVVTTEPGVVFPDSDPMSLPRVIPPPPMWYFACETARYFFFPKRRMEGK
jgi:peptidoglycan/xylan/chitin deacetylase (PgdA/CDA1 family)